MSKSIKLKDNVYLDSSGITHNKELLSVLLNNLLSHTLIFSSYPATGERGTLSAPNSSYTISDRFSKYDFLLFVVSSRVWGWATTYMFVPYNDAFKYTSSSPDNYITMSVPIYNSNIVGNIQFYLTNDNKITVYSNSHYTEDNHIYIKGIYGYRIIK